MAVRGWGGSIATAIGVAAGAGAAQLGLGYGLGIIAWLPTTNGGSEATWVASLAWATFIAATSVVAGAITADRVSGPAEPVDAPDDSDPARADASGGRDVVTPLASALWRLALAMAAAVGALVTVALVAVPARTAERADTFSPQTIAAGYAIVGVVVGLFVALCALASRAVATNVISTVAWLWLLAVIAVIDGVAAGRGLASAQLAAWKFTGDGDGYWFRNMYLPGVALSLGSALIIGALTGLPFARRGDNRVGVAASGAVGPLLVAAAYFLAAPKLVGVRAEQLSAYLVAPYAVIAGLAGSVLVAAFVVRPAPGTPHPAEEPFGAESAAGADAADGSAATGSAADGGFGAGRPVPVRGGADLADDAYAPARAYASDTAGEPAGTGGRSGGKRGRATVTAPEPVWPDEATPSRGKPARRPKPRAGR